MRSRIIAKAVVLAAALCATAFAQVGGPAAAKAPRGNEIAAYVYGMENAKLGEDLSFAIVTGLAADKKYSEAKKGARDFYKKADIEQKKKHGRLLEDKDFCKIGADYGVEYLCIIDIEKAGRGNSIWARILDLEKCQIIATAEATKLVRNDGEVAAVASDIVKELTQRKIGKRSIAVAEPPPPPPPPPRGNEIAAYVYGMENAKLGEDLSFAIVTGLAADKKYSEAKKGARDFYKKADQEQKKKHGKLLEDKDFCKIGADYGVEYLCIIDIEKAGRGNSVWARILDLETCQIVATAEATKLVRNDGEVKAVADEIVKELTHRRIGKRSIAVEAAPAPAPVAAAPAAAAPKGRGGARPEIPGMIWIDAGTFTKGSPTSEPGRDTRGRETQHEVTLTEGFYIGKYEVTQKQWLEGNGAYPGEGSKPSPAGDNIPMGSVTWYEAIAFCNKLSMKEGLSPAYRIGNSTDPATWGPAPKSAGAADKDARDKWHSVEIVAGSTGYRLPTDAQWEYACRAGTKAAFNWGTEFIDSTRASFYSAGSDPSNPVKGKSLGHGDVGRFAPNAWGLYDMHGGVCEWVWDWSSDKVTSAAQADPIGPATGTYKMGRGGGFNTYGKDTRSAAQFTNYGYTRSASNGLRLVRPAF